MIWRRWWEGAYQWENKENVRSRSMVILNLRYVVRITGFGQQEVKKQDCPTPDHAGNHLQYHCHQARFVLVIPPSCFQGLIRNALKRVRDQKIATQHGVWTYSPNLGVDFFWRQTSCVLQAAQGYHGLIGAQKEPWRRSQQTTTLFSSSLVPLLFWRWISV